MLTCEQVDRLDAEFAARSLDTDQLHAVEDHLARCDRHSGLAAYRAALLALDLATEPQKPPPGLRQRVLATAASTDRRPGFGPAGWFVAAAAAVAVVIIAAGLVLVLRGGDSDDGVSRSFEAEGGIQVQVQASYAEPETTVTFANLAVLPQGEEYTVWAIRDTEWLRMGTFRSNDDGWWSGTFAFQVRPGDALCVTAGPPVEGSPHGTPLFIEPL